MTSRPPRIFVRSRILSIFVAFSFMGYVHRTSISVTAQRMMPTLGLSQVQIGWLMTAFLIGYTVFQLPSAALGRRIGAHRTMTALGIVTILSSCSVALVPAFAPHGILFAWLWAAQFAMGVAQAALFPVASGALEAWFPRRNWAFGQGWLTCGIWLGSAFTAPAIAWCMEEWNWQTAIYLSCLPSLVLVALWQWYGRNSPLEHPGVSAAELSELEPSSEPGVGQSSQSLAWLRSNPALWLVTLSYFLTNYVFYLVTFWSFLYLVQDRHFSTLESGWLASLPFLAAAVAAPVGGRLSDRLTARFGARRGVRVVPLLALPAAAIFLYLTITAATPYAAILFLSCAFAGVELTEGPYWSVAMRSAPAYSMQTTAFLNTGGNLGGIVATPIIAALTATRSWPAVFATGAVLSIMAAVLWLWIKIPAPVAVLKVEPAPLLTVT